MQAHNLGQYLYLYSYFYLCCISRVKIIFVPRSGPNLARGGNLEQIWEVKVRNCRQAQNCRLGGGGRCGNDALLCIRCCCWYWLSWCWSWWCWSSLRCGLPEAAFVSVEASLRKTCVKRQALASWNFTFSPIAIGDSLPFHSRFGLFIPARWRSVFQWAPCGAQEVTLGPAKLGAIFPMTPKKRNSKQKHSI